MSRSERTWRLAGWAAGLLLLCWGMIYFWPVKQEEKHSFFKNDRPLVMAHQGGAHLAPPSTMEAFTNAAALGVDVIEFDVHMTADGHLVAIHDATVGRTTDGTGKVNELTLEEIKALDAGSSFRNELGSSPYKGKGVQIPTVEEIFTAIPDMRWNIEIKATNDPALYEEIAENLWHSVMQYELTEAVLFASFDQNIIEMITEASGGQALIAGGKQEITQFVLLHKLFLNGLYHTDIDAIEIPTEEYGINLADKKLIKAAEKRGIDVHYWTINDPEKMHELLDLGANGILTDRPDVLLKVLEDRGF